MMMSASTVNHDGSTRRRPVSASPSTPLTTVEEGSGSPAKKNGRKRSIRSMQMGRVIIAFSCCSIAAFLLLSSPQTRIKEPRPIIRSVPQPKIDKLQPKNDKLLALIYPPGIMGGYRNQVIRLLSLVVYALKQNVTSILLPSMQWSTRVDDQISSGPIPMDLLMDIDYWNSFHPKLPRFVDYNPKEEYDCWHVDHDYLSSLPPNASQLTRQVVSRGFLTPIYNLSRDVASRQDVPRVNLRQTDLLPNVTHCRHPMAYGGGRMGGRLWNDYVELRDDIPFHAQALVLQALRPREQWRTVATACVQQHTKNKENNNYIALHARVELDMMVHRCGQGMEKNFTRILEMMSDLSTEQQDEPIDGVFVAVSRRGMEHQEKEPGYKSFQAFVEENVVTLNRLTKEGLQNGRLPVFECGRQALHDYFYSLNPGAMDYGTTLQAMVNFHVATEAKIFVGVKGSSYSTDIWMTRYHQGKGDTNYEYTPKGIVKVGNGGLPPVHGNCKK